MLVAYRLVHPYYEKDRVEANKQQASPLQSFPYLRKIQERMLARPDLGPVATQFTLGVDKFHGVDQLATGVTLVQRASSYLHMGQVP
ncbi:hypothetical protein DPMN_169768 [Dreissena polymorpha]|uniref:Uncharacterized protein n=1 Tax=Dreissena polymorpha TaxID=45954 RepID=A0A9D4DWM1_DREPO|nr:hypothetical protein DPMN_169768 [Dreissena polymorpha]